jgi:hypothetical protein
VLVSIFCHKYELYFFINLIKQKNNQMKKTIFTLAAVVLTSVSLFAQIPNNGFEIWTSAGTYSNPASWDQLNSMTTGMSVYTCTKGTPGAVGTSYLKLVSKTVSGMGIMPGVAVSGVIDMATFKPKSGFPFAMQPQKLTGSWQYMASGADAGFVSVYLTKWNSAMMMRDTIAKAKQNLSGMAMSWAVFNINLTYMSSAMPDSAMIILSASGNTPVANSYLYVDNLSFAGTVTGINNIDNYVSNIVTYPNPSTDNISIELTAQKSSTIKLQLVDVTGKLINEVNAGVIQGNYKHTINTTNIAKGIYFLKVSANDAVEVKKIVIQ